MKVGFIGAGKVGFTLGKYFSDKGISLSGYYSKSLSSAVEGAKFTSSSYFEDIEKFINETDIIFITVPDDKIKEVYNMLSNFNITDKIICHTSGSLSSQILCDNANSGSYSYSIHPIYAFSDKYTSYKNLSSAYFSIEGSDKYLDYMKNLIEGLGNKVISIDTQEKALYHASCVVGANLVLSLLQIATSYMMRFNLSEEDALSALWPLITNNLNNIKANGFVPSITGPIERGDINTVKKHLDNIPAEHRDLYIDLSKNLLSLCRIKNKEKDYSSLNEYLGGWSK